MGASIAAEPQWFRDFASRLPGADLASPRNESDFYGASQLVAESLGWVAAPDSQAVWTHGWHYNPPDFVETYLWNRVNPEFAVLTHREDEADFLRSKGVDRAVAVGAPFLYTAEQDELPRLPHSLLIMPFHSLDETRHAADEAAYFEALDPFLSRFEHVVACVHPSCIAQNLWIENLSRRGIPHVEGANVRDRRALRRMRALFSSFTHVTSNWIGSHVPYAAMTGCSVSIHGPPPDFREENYREQPFYKAHPQILARDLALWEKGYVRRNFAAFFRAPDCDSDDRAWASDCLGAGNRKSSADLARLLGWKWSQALAADHPFDKWAAVLGWEPENAEVAKLRERVVKLSEARDAHRRKAEALQQAKEALKRERDELSGRLSEMTASRSARGFTSLPRRIFEKLFPK